MTATQSDSDGGRRLDRRTFVKSLGVTGAAAVGLTHNRGAAQNAQAVAPLVGYAVGAAAISAVGGVGVGWSLREFEIIGSDAPPEGLTASALQQQAYQTALTRQSTNASTIVDNENILDGVEHNAYTEAKIAAIEQLNAGATETEVLNAATNTIDAYETTVRSNLLKTWNESVTEFVSTVQLVNNHTDLNYSDVLDGQQFAGWQDNTVYKPYSFTDVSVKETTQDLPDGTSMTVRSYYIKGTRDSGGTADVEVSPYNKTENVTQTDGDTYPTGGVAALSTPEGSVTYLKFDDWNSIATTIDTTFQNVRDGISTWVTNVYGQVQSGEIEVSDLVTPKERAAMMSQEEGMSQAIADLIALNIPVDAEREATITINDTGATLTGTFALTDSSDGPIESGTTYDPSTFAGDVYFTADMSLVEGPWDAINSSVDGGNITITSEPYEGTAIEVTTVASETVSVPAADWSDNGDGTWTYDASNDLETIITNVDSASFHATATETQYETIQLKGSFTVEKLLNTQSGEEVTATSFSSSAPQDDTNYITQEEWDQLEQQNQELIEKYEESQSSGGAGAGFFSGSSPDVGLVAAAVGGIGVVYALFGQGETS